jgi:hypothetical protein
MARALTSSVVRETIGGLSSGVTELAAGTGLAARDVTARLSER